MTTPADLPADVAEAWREALELWGVALQPPVLADGRAVGAFAWFTFPPRAHVDLRLLDRAGGQRHLASVLAHEIGHHVLSPGTRLTALTIDHQIGRVLQVVDPDGLLPPAERAGGLANLWSDLVINARVAHLQTRRHPGAEPDIVTLWRALQRDQTGGRRRITASWWVVMRAYEHLWSLPGGSLCPPRPTATTDPALHPDVDAALLADTVRTFGRDPVAGALPFAMIVVPYLVDEARLGIDRVLARNDVRRAGRTCGRTESAPMTADELAQVLADPRVRVTPRHPAVADDDPVVEPVGDELDAGDGGQAYDLASTLALHAAMPRGEVLRAWYEERARRWIRPLHQQLPAAAGEALPGPLEVWEAGDDPAAIDWPATLRGGRVVPGITTRRRTWTHDEEQARPAAVDVDVYLDCSGSMPSPQAASPAILAAMVLTGSVLRGGGRARVASFSGAGQVAGSPGWTRDRRAVAEGLLHYVGGGTTFPLDLLAARYLEQRSEQALRAAGVVRRHLVVFSDDGLDSMFGAGQEQHADVAARVRARLDTATLVLLGVSPGTVTAQAAARAGYDVEVVDALDDVPQVAARLAARLAGVATDHEQRQREVAGGRA